MTTILGNLKNQHENIAKLIRIVDQQVDKVAEAEMPNVQLLLDIMQYLSRYVDAVHHPVEEALIERMRQRTGNLSEQAREIQAQHNDLVPMAEEFLAMVEAVQEEQLVEREKFVKQGREFVSAQFSHMGVEEDSVFPELEASLQAEDYEQASLDIENSRDPLFGDIVEKEYEKLYDFIIRSAE